MRQRSYEPYDPPKPEGNSLQCAKGLRFGAEIATQLSF